ncbi:MAG: 30S ribosomal protein S5 [Candidatus Pacebacteria bacterium]|nr:30S ribosomal protein S5 [Candidatus Paceibacterota bacterium]
MSENNNLNEEVVQNVEVKANVEEVSAEAPKEFSTRRGAGNNRGGGNRNGSKGSSRARPPREKPEFDSKTIDIRRVTRVVSGGRRFSLAVALAAGDKNGRIGFGTGKALDTQAAIEKAMKSAKKNMFTLKLSKGNTIPFDVKVKYKSASIWLSPNKGKGIIAGSSARTILALAGVNNVTAKFHSGTKNKMNNAKATIKALQMFTR